MRELSKYFSDDGRREATIYMENGRFYVSAKSASGTTYQSTHENESMAELFAEEWVTKDE